MVKRASTVMAVAAVVLLAGVVYAQDNQRLDRGDGANIDADANVQRFDDTVRTRGGDEGNWLYMTRYGDIMETVRSRTAIKLTEGLEYHPRVDILIGTGDYFRGLYDGVQQCDDLAYQLIPTATFVGLPDLAWFEQVTLTLGVPVGMTTDSCEEANSCDCFYELDPYIGLASQIGDDWRTGLTWTSYLVPNDVMPDRHELAASVRYVGDNVIGWFQPQAKIAIPMSGNNDGLYVEGRVDPGFTLMENTNTPMAITFPLIVGIGFSDYYGDETDDAVYAQVGAHLEMPLNFVDESWGDWSLLAAVDLIMREDDIRDAGQPCDDADTCFVVGWLGLRWMY